MFSVLYISCNTILFYIQALLQSLVIYRLFHCQEIYLLTYFDQWLYNRYKHWIELGRPKKFNAGNETNNKIYNEQLSEEIDEENLENPVISSTLVENEDLANGCEICKKIGPKPLAIPGKTWVIGWVLIDTPKKEVVEKSFEEVILDKMKGPMQKEQTKRKKN